MKDYELVGHVLDECEAVASDTVSSFSWDSAPPVNTWGSADSTKVPTILVDDREEHVRAQESNNPYAGVATDDKGNVLGAQLEFVWKATPEIVVRTTHETETYKLADEIKQVLYKIVRDIQAYNTTWQEDARSFSIGNPYNREVNLDIPGGDSQRAFVRAIPISVTYVDRIVYDGPEPIEKFKNEYHVSDNLEGDESVITNTVDSTTYS